MSRGGWGREACDGSDGLETGSAFVGWWTGVRLALSGRQEVIDRPISRAERMALVLRITRFIGTTMKPAWHARCHPSPCAGLGIFSTGTALLSPLSLMRAPGDACRRDAGRCASLRADCVQLRVRAR